MHHRHSLLAEATDAGFLGGSVVAVWFLLRDILLGRPLLTPSVLGQFLLLGQRDLQTEEPVFAAVLLYTIVHFAAFLLFGFVLAWLFRLSVREPVFRFALLVLFVVFELFFYVVIRTFAGAVGELFPAFWVLSANLLAALVMGRYFWRKYPGLKRALRREPLGA